MERGARHRGRPSPAVSPLDRSSGRSARNTTTSAVQPSASAAHNIPRGNGRPERPLFAETGFSVTLGGGRDDGACNEDASSAGPRTSCVQGLAAGPCSTDAELSRGVAVPRPVAPAAPVALARHPRCPLRPLPSRPRHPRPRSRSPRRNAPGSISDRSFRSVGCRRGSTRASSRTRVNVSCGTGPARRAVGCTYAAAASTSATITSPPFSGSTMIGSGAGGSGSARAASSSRRASRSPSFSSAARILACAVLAGGARGAQRGPPRGRAQGWWGRSS